MDRQRYPVGAHEVFFLSLVDTLRLPVIVMDDVRISHYQALGDNFLIVEADRCMEEAYLLGERRWSKGHR